MSARSSTELVFALLAFSLVAGALGWSRYGRTVWPPVSAAALAGAAVVAAVSDDLESGRVTTTALVGLTALLAVAGGGPVTTWIFTFVDRSDPGASKVSTGDVLRGGAWIGSLERLAVFAGLAAGFPEGVAVVLALKGVGRYPALRDQDTGDATTERFIIGTFASVLWAAACAGLIALTHR